MSTIKSSTTTTTAYAVEADTTGALVIQTGATPTTAVTVGSDQAINFAGAPSIGGAGLGMGMGFRNRIINGAMVIDQRNAGAASANTINGYFLDRWNISQSTLGKLIAQQNAGTVTPPAGFSNYLGVTSQSAYSVTSTDFIILFQRIEGFNVSDFAWGTASAVPVTVSFWVRSSLTGSFGGSLRNGAGTRSYPFAFTISSANTWEQKTVTIAGDTSGTWETNNTAGLILGFSFGSGSTRLGPVNAWATANYDAPTGATSVVGTNGATFYITGVQLEKGSTATSFDYRPYGTELQLCQRYYFKNMPAVAGSNVATGVFNGTTNLVITPILPVPMRSAPTMTQVTMSVANGVTGNAVTSIGTQAFGVNSGLVVMNGTSASYATGQAGYLYTQATSSYVDFTAEL